MRTCGSVFLLLALAAPAQALSPDRAISQYARTAWGRVDGLPQNAITALAETDDGYLWVGTQEGLARFDGAGFTIFDRGNTDAFDDHFITALARGTGGALWIGTRRGLVRLSAGSFERVGETELPDSYVRALLEDRQGRLWVGTYGGGLAVREPPGTWRVLTVKEGLADPTVRALLEDRAGFLWVGTSRGLQRLGPGGDEHEWRFAGARGLGSPFVRSLREDREGNLWVGTQDRGLHRRREGLLFEPVEGLFGGAEVTIDALFVDAGGSLWIGTSGLGLGRLSSGRFARWSADEGLLHDVVWCFLEDREGSLWVGTRGGLLQLREGNAVPWTVAEGLSDGFVRTVLEDREGTLWIGTGGAGVDRLRDGAIETVALPGESGSRVRSLLLGRDGAVWLGTEGAIFRFDGDEWKVYTVRDGLPNRDVNALAETPDGVLWAATGGGLARLENGRFRVFTLSDGLPSDSVRAVLPARDGGLWVGTEEGLARYESGRFTIPTPSDPAGLLRGAFVLTLHEDARRVLWIGTSGEGLLRLEGDGLTRYTERDGLYDDLIFQILEDGRGGLWMSCNRGVFRVETSELEAFARGGISRLHPRSLTEADGLPSAECNGGSQPAGWRGADGRLWFPTIAGLAVVDPARLRHNEVPPPVIIESVEIDGQVVTPRERTSEVVRIPARGRRIAIHYTAPSFVSPGKVRFRYFLEGFEESWLETGPRRTVYFTSLPPGDYRFRVVAANSDGVWSREAAVLLLHQEPFLYETVWFWASVLVVLIGFVWAGHRWRLRSLIRREEELVRTVDRRTRELAEANRALERLASLDSLTEIPNHRSFQVALDEEWRRATRTGRPLAVLMIDIDSFKRYNDTYGHQEGDRCLRRVAGALRLQVGRPGDLVARYGGEEFTAVLANTGLAAARELAERMRRAVEELGIEHGAAVAATHVTVSVGAASTVPSPASNPDELLAAADKALYRAKAEGRNRVV